MRSFANTFLFMCLLGSTLVYSQEQDPNPLKFGPNSAPKLPADACFYATIHVKEIVAMPELKLFPWEIISAAGVDNLGFDPLAIDRLDMIGGFQETLGPQFRFVIVARTNNAIEVAPEAAAKLLNEQGLSTVVLNDRFTLVGDYEYMKQVVNGSPADGELKKQVARIGDSAIAWCALVTAPIGKQVQELLDSADEEHREQFATILKKTKLVAARLDLKSSSIPVIAETESEADAIEVEKVINDFIVLTREAELARAQQTAMQMPKRVGDALIQFANRFGEDYKRVMVVSRKGSRLSAKLDQEYYEVSQMGSYIPIITGAVQALNAQLGQQ